MKKISNAPQIQENQPSITKDNNEPINNTQSYHQESSSAKVIRTYKVHGCNMLIKTYSIHGRNMVIRTYSIHGRNMVKRTYSIHGRNTVIRTYSINVLDGLIRLKYLLMYRLLSFQFSPHSDFVLFLRYRVCVHQLSTSSSFMKVAFKFLVMM